MFLTKCADHSPSFETNRSKLNKEAQNVTKICFETNQFCEEYALINVHMYWSYCSTYWNLALDEQSDQIHAPAALIPSIDPSWIGDWITYRALPNALKKNSNFYFPANRFVTISTTKFQFRNGDIWTVNRIIIWKNVVVVCLWQDISRNFAWGYW